MKKIVLFIFFTVFSSPLFATSHPQNYTDYTAFLTCELFGSRVSILACFKRTDLKVSMNGIARVYKTYDMASGKPGRDGPQGLIIHLPEHFEITAQNGDDVVVLGLRIEDSNGVTVFQDQVGLYGVIRVSN